MRKVFILMSPIVGEAEDAGRGDGLEEYLEIENGVTIDHIPPGKALEVLKVLGITPEGGDSMIVLMNVRSTKMGKKDVIKLENVKLDPAKTVAKIRGFAPKVTVNVIKNFEVTKKVRA